MRTPQRVTGASPSSQSASASTVPWEERRKAIPTYLTWLRVLATPAVGVAYCSNATWGMPVPAALAIFVAAAITDWLDGVLARKWDAMTPFGAFLDPVADKVMVCTSLVLLCSRTPAALAAAPAWLLALPTCAIVGREIAVSALREWAATMPKGNNGDEGSDADDVAIPVSIWGKLKTATQLVAISFLLLGAGPSAFASAAVESAVKVGVVLLYISAALALASGADYAKGVMNR
ncbi:hypothetical protein PPROV_000295600 [Pycnococcus provasolii]|uniref:CDP-diacylglycerol--glycerol-3-phosphate 3-phosphatidyltransferase n=1 Tax=Pycnococcus provasolii TaxID=41880 RepID=A0A830HC12_9CHLO|nr:hypothetical protein PPROV_000295600 [Pycnococcus provasolii]